MEMNRNIELHNEAVEAKKVVMVGYYRRRKVETPVTKTPTAQDRFMAIVRENNKAIDELERELQRRAQ